MAIEPKAFSLPQRIAHDGPHPLWDATQLLKWTRDLTQRGGRHPSEWPEQAGQRLASLSLALHPHAQHFWMACGPGHNGLDGMHAARRLKALGKRVTVTCLGALPHGMEDLSSLLSADPPSDWDVAVDALFGIGLNRRIEETEPAGQWMRAMHALDRPVVHMDLPSGLCPRSGQWLGPDVPLSSSRKDTLAMLGMSVGLWTNQGRDRSGQIWLSACDAVQAPSPTAHLIGQAAPLVRTHSSHKGTHGHVIVVGGNLGMQGAALLAARSALTHGAGIVHWLAPHLANGDAPTDLRLAPIQIMHHWPSTWRGNEVVVAGCGAGSMTESFWHEVLTRSPQLVLDADGLNALAQSPALSDRLRMRKRRHQPTVITPHPLEAARLLGCDVPSIQADRLQSAQSLSQKWGCVTLLKGSGTVIATPEGETWINPTGNARLATAGSGDVLSGCLGALLAQGAPEVQAAKQAAFEMGRLAESSATMQHAPLTADQQALAQWL